MDARPQRPTRKGAQGDENAILPSAKQTLHQRNKSTSALNMMAIGILNEPPKRTAFADVSNSFKANASHDDSAIGGKSIPSQDFVKATAPQDKPASGAFLGPARRPLNAPTVKGPINAQPIPPPVHTIPTAPQVQQQQLQAAIKRTFSKRGTAVYKDTSDVEQQPQAIRQPAAPTAPVHQNLGPRHHKSQPQLKADQPNLRRTQSRLISVEASETVITSDQIYQDAPEEQLPESSKLMYGAFLKSVAQSESVPAYEVSKATEDAFKRLNHNLPAPPLVSEPEEYWEEEEEEIYDEQGYTTAHSYHSRGDNTTGGATTVLLPKVTNKVKKELAEAKVLVESSRTLEEIDDELWDTSMVAEYGDEIFAYMRELESKMLPDPHYMDNQAEIQWSMRSVLMDWLIQVHHRFSLLPETLFLCVNYIDRFLSCKIVSLGKLQLVGATAIFVAAKYEEINCPGVNEIVYMVDGGYTVDEILKAERFMLSMLQFELGWPGPMSFLRRISKADDYDLETRTLAKYFLEITIMDERFVGSPPSYIAAGAHCLSRMMLKKGDWSPAHVYYSGYTWTQLRPLVSMILECCESPEKHHSAVFEKYSDRRYKRASTFVQSEVTRGFTLPQFQVTPPSLPPIGDVDDLKRRLLDSLH